MKKMLTLLTVAMIAASLTGCSCCRRLCPWLDRGAYCGSPAPLFAPLAAAAPAPVAMPAYQPYQYAQPLAATGSPCCQAPMAAAPAAQCCAPQTQCCSSWDPCQGQVNYSYPQQAPSQPACCPQAGYAPMSVMPMAYGEPGCGYEPGCGSPYMGGMMSYGPVMSGGCDTCNAGYSGPGPVVSPAPTSAMPTPGD